MIPRKIFIKFIFSETNDIGEIEISNEQLSRVINLDDAWLSLVRNERRRGGRSSSQFFNTTLLEYGKYIPKSSVTMTFIDGSNAIGEALPPHFQVSTKQQKKEKGSGWRW